MAITPKAIAAVLVIVGSLSSAAGCSTIADLQAAAKADRAAHPEKYLEDPVILRQQMTPNQEGMAYPQFCTWGCGEQIDLTRNW